MAATSFTPGTGLPESASRTTPTTDRAGGAKKSARAEKYCSPTITLPSATDVRVGGTCSRVTTIAVGGTTLSLSKRRETVRSTPTPVMRNRPSGPVVVGAIGVQTESW